MNSQLTELLEIYSLSHQNKINQKIHKVAVPLIMFSLFGILSLFKISSFDFCEVFCLIAFFYYLRFKSVKVILIITLQIIPLLMLIYFYHSLTFAFYFGVFTLAWLAQFIGHKIEGKKPSFLQDIQFLLIGPIWIFKKYL